MTQTFEDAGKFGKEFMDTGLKSLAIVLQGLAVDRGRGDRIRQEEFRDRQRRGREAGFGEVAGKGDRDPDRLRQDSL